ncbi:MAG: tetratricopeptide repeat protein [Microcoleaceae cyanobacterium]
MRLSYLKARCWRQGLRSGITVAVLALNLASCDRSRQSPQTSLEIGPVPAAVTSAPLQPSLPSPSAQNLTNAREHRQLGLQYRDQGRYKEAISELQKSVALDPQNLSGQVILGWTFHLDGQEEAAIQALQTALAQDPAHVPALNALGIVYLVKGDLEQAVNIHRRAVELDPENEIGYYNLSLAYHRLQNYDQAIANATRATELEPNNPHSWVALAIATWSQGEKLSAQQAYQQATELDDRYSSASFLEHLQQAGLNQEQIQVTNAVRESR